MTNQLSMQVSPGAEVQKKGSSATHTQRAILRWITTSRVGQAMGIVNVLTMQGIPLLSLAVMVRRALRLFRIVKRVRKPLLHAVGWTLLESWAVLEVVFWLYFRWKKQCLEAKRAYQPSVLWKTPGERRRLLSNMLANVERIHTGSIEARRRGECGLVGAAMQLMPSLGAPKGQRRRQRRPSFGLLSPSIARVGDGDAEQPVMQRLRSAPSVENFLRFQEPDSMLPATDDAGSPVQLQRHGSGLYNPELGRSAPSIENLLQCWDEGQSPLGGLVLPEKVQANKELACLKHLELCSWYRRVKQNEICQDVAEIRHGNVEEWVLSYLFDGAEAPEALTEAERGELGELVEEVRQWIGLKGIQRQAWEGRNANLRCFRLRNDPFPAVHRPLFTYAMTAFVAPTLGGRALKALGFRVYRAGSTEYWFRPPSPDQDWLGSRGPRRPCAFPGGRPPLVFCHGIGVGPTMCLFFVDKLTKALGQNVPIFLVDTAAVSMRFSDDVPCARELAANMVDMLKVWGFQRGHFVGHSFGSFLLAWMLRYQKPHVERLTFLDPVCFLLLKVLVEGHELQQVRHETKMNAMEMAIKYFVLTELFVCNFVCRNFFWEESQLDMQDLQDCESLLVLESEDAIVPTHSVRCLVYAEQARRAACTESGKLLDIFWVDAQPHAGFLADVEVAEEAVARLGAFHSRSASLA